MTARTTRNFYFVSAACWFIAVATLLFSQLRFGPVHWWMWTMIAGFGLNLVGYSARRSRPQTYTTLLITGGALSIVAAIGAIMSSIAHPAG